MLQDLVLVPLFRGEVKVLNLGSCTSQEDLDRSIRRHCQLLLGSQHKQDERG